MFVVWRGGRGWGGGSSGRGFRTGRGRWRLGSGCGFWLFSVAGWRLVSGVCGNLGFVRFREFFR